MNNGYLGRKVLNLLIINRRPILKLSSHSQNMLYQSCKTSSAKIKAKELKTCLVPCLI